MGENRSKAGQFQPGVSGNPNGRPKKIPAFVARIRREEPKLWLELLRIAKGEARKGARKRPSDKDVLKALELCFAYSRGRPSSKVELTGKDGGPVHVMENDGIEILKDPGVREALQRAALRRATGDAGDAGDVRK